MLISKWNQHTFVISKPLFCFLKAELCAPKEAGPCEVNEWQCQSGDQCVPRSFHCDGQIDCTDSSDEIGCGM